MLSLRPFMNSLAQFKNKGFTLIELLLVIAIIAILGSMTTPFLSRFVLKTHFDSTRQKISSALHKAQGYAMNSKNGQTWGVCYVSNSIRLYSGTCNSPTTTETYIVPTSITISNFTDVLFDKRGQPSSTPTISVVSRIDTASITITESGGIR